MYEIKTEKDRIRTEYLDKRRKIPPDRKDMFDNKICERFMSLVTYRYSDAVLMYAPKPNEINVDVIAKKALQAGKVIAFPRCNVRDCTMQFHIVNDLSELESGIYDILEPPQSAPVFSSKEFNSACCLVPALVYDYEGYRLGYGKGYYDRYLSAFKGAKVGFAYSDFILEQLPRGRYDLAVDVVVTEKGVSALYAG